MIVISVRDNGNGIPDTIKEKIMQPFFTTKPTGEGTGLGLSTSMAIIKSHGGFCNVYSELGKGTRFTIYLPAGVATTPENPPGKSMALPRGNGETVLVVDDEEPLPLNRLDPHLLGEKGVLEVGRVVDPRRQQDDRRRAARCRPRREAARVLQQLAAAPVDGRHP